MNASSRGPRPPGIGLLWAALAITVISHQHAQAEEVTQTFTVPEGSPQGTLVGTIGSAGSQPPYLIVPQSDLSDLSVNSQTGEIRTRTVLDREKVSGFLLSAIPVSGDDPVKARNTLLVKTKRKIGTYTELGPSSFHRAAERLEMEKKFSRVLESAMRTASLRGSK